MKALICGALAAVIVTAASAAEDIHSASFVLRYCKLAPAEAAANVSNTWLNGRCNGMVQGIIDTFRFIRGAEILMPNSSLCADIPIGVDPKEVSNEIAKLAEKYPDAASGIPFTTFVMTVLPRAWPCKK
jgi:hypothetical protein